MADHLIQSGSTTAIITAKFRSSTTGNLVTGLTSSSFVCTYQRAGVATSTTVSLTAGTLGTYGSGQIVETAQGGTYQFSIPSGAVASGVPECEIKFTATGIIDAVEHVIITGQSGSVPVNNSAGNVPVDLQTIKTQTVTAAAGVTFPSSIGTSTLTGTAQTGDSFAYLGTNHGLLGANATALAPSSTALSTATWTGTIAGRIDAAVSSRSTLTQAQVSGYAGPILTDNSTGLVSANAIKWGGTNVTGMPMPTYAQPTGFLAATFPSTVSSYTGTSQTGDAYAYLGTNLGLLGANATSLAPASTALSTANWTNTRAGYLDTLNGIVATIWSYATRVLTAGTNIVLAKGTGVTGLNDIAATAIVSGGAITTSSGAVSVVTSVTAAVALPTTPPSGYNASNAVLNATQSFTNALSTNQTGDVGMIISGGATIKANTVEMGGEGITVPNPITFGTHVGTTNLLSVDSSGLVNFNASNTPGVFAGTVLANTPGGGGGGSGLTAQQTRDSMLLAPTGSSAPGSIDAQLAAIAEDGGGGTVIVSFAQAVEAYGIRTQTANSIGFVQGDYVSLTFTNLGTVTDATEIWLTIKPNSPSFANVPDSQATLQTQMTIGLKYLAGAPISSPVAAGDSSIVVNDGDATGSITWTLNSRASMLVPGNNNAYSYSIRKQTSATDAITLAVGTCKVSPTVTQAI